MLHVRNSILKHMRLSYGTQLSIQSGKSLNRSTRCMGVLPDGANSEQLMARVVGLVKKFDKIDANKVTETADFQKDLSLDSLDRVELVMAFEQEFSIEIPDAKADKLTCCADVVQYILSEAHAKKTESS